MPIFSAPRVISGRRLLAPGAVAVEDGRVVEVLDRRPPPGPGHTALDRGVLAPGLIDLQLNGAFGVDLVDADPDGWQRVLSRLPSTGVTALLATFISAPVEDLAAAMGRAAAARTAAAKRGQGSRLLGVHLEGPFLSERRRGAHDASHLVDPTPELVDRLTEAGAEVLALLTLAPERDGAIEATKRLAGAGVLVSVGHSDALADQVAAAAEAGARMVTHLFNAQRGLHHREPGVAGQALADPRLACGLIADLHHVHPAICRVVMEAARARVALVTDAVSALGMPPGRYELGSEVVELHEGSPPLRADGTLAGSNLRLDEAVGNVVGLGVDPVRAVEAATTIPADLLGRHDLGRLEPGARADLVWLSDSWRALATWVDGVKLWEAP
jgi:N-acetylglucosamine-6-phosphate deacetylase